ncbi:UNVERIFIED_CONTAM: hypothetical protein HDU68_003366 [Siphonaria sp. JEL0065]|nr:hypothetical protein HDU68_003366 [Siphonaria sp. JEL0065]
MYTDKEESLVLVRKHQREHSLALSHNEHCRSWRKHWCLFVAAAVAIGLVASQAIPSFSHSTSASTQPTTTSSVTSAPSYQAQFISTKPALDGSLSGPWENATTTSLSVDITGNGPAPRYNTTTMMLWDSNYLYIGARIQDPDVWSTMSTKNSPLYQQNNFEFFIDPDFDGLNYYEFEINPLGTTWQMSLDSHEAGGFITDPNEIEALVSKVQVQGTLNKVGDVDQGWTVEIAIPWSGFSRFNTKKQGVPNNGDSFRVQFARTAWGFSVDASGSYVKSRQSSTWVWAGMNGGKTVHDPSLWGSVSFAGNPNSAPSSDSLIPPNIPPSSSSSSDNAVTLSGGSSKPNVYIYILVFVSIFVFFNFGFLVIFCLAGTCASRKVEKCPHCGGRDTY